jgi:hypothetical protein
MNVHAIGDYPDKFAEFVCDSVTDRDLISTNGIAG